MSYLLIAKFSTSPASTNCTAEITVMQRTEWETAIEQLHAYRTEGQYLTSVHVIAAGLALLWEVPVNEIDIVYDLRAVN